MRGRRFLAHAHPDPTPTASPTSSPVDFDFAKSFTAKASNTGFAFAFFKPDAGGDEVWSDGNRRDGTSEITYDVAPEKVTYVWPDTLTIPAFRAADLESSSATVRQYRKGSDGLLLELPFEHVLRVSFERSQSYIRETVAGTLRSFRYALFFNPVTATADITADLTYSGSVQVVGGLSGTSKSDAFTATVTDLVYSASTKKVTGTLKIFETVSGAPVERAALPISVTPASTGAFLANTEDTANAFKGLISGSLAGPNREELFFVFSVAHTDKREFLGSVMARR